LWEKGLLQSWNNLGRLLFFFGVVEVLSYWAMRKWVWRFGTGGLHGWVGEKPELGADFKALNGVAILAILLQKMFL